MAKCHSRRFAPSTTYNFTYGAFDLRSGVSIGNRTLATYHYTDEEDNDRKYDLGRLDYGNRGSVQYEYDDEHQLIKRPAVQGTTEPSPCPRNITSTQKERLFM